MPEAHQGAALACPPVGRERHPEGACAAQHNVRIAATPPPAAAAWVDEVAVQRRRPGAMIETPIDELYLRPLRATPEDEHLRARLKVYVGLQRLDTAIAAGFDLVMHEGGDRAATFNHLGIACCLNGEARQAAYYFKQALDLKPKDEGIRRNHERALWALGRGRGGGGADPGGSG